MSISIQLVSNVCCHMVMFFSASLRPFLPKFNKHKEEICLMYSIELWNLNNMMLHCISVCDWFERRKLNQRLTYGVSVSTEKTWKRKMKCITERVFLTPLMFLAFDHFLLTAILFQMPSIPLTMLLNFTKIFCCFSTSQTLLRKDIRDISYKRKMSSKVIICIL